MFLPPHHPPKYHSWPITRGVDQGRPLACHLLREQDAVKPQPLHHCPYSKVPLRWLEHTLPIAYSRSFSEILSRKKCPCWVGEFWGSNSLHIPRPVTIMLSFLLFPELRGGWGVGGTLLATSSFGFWPPPSRISCGCEWVTIYRWPFMCVTTFHPGNDPSEINIMIISLLQRRKLRFRQVN